MTARAWITGARGFIGRSLARHLADAGAEVAGVGHGHWPDAVAAGVGCWVNADIHAASLDLLLARTGPPDVVYHLAGGSAVGPSFANPLEDFERTVHTMQDEATNFADPNDRASQESDMALELRSRDRERKLIKKIDETIGKIDSGS